MGEVCDCCTLRELIKHMNRNHISQTYQEYLLPTPKANGEHIGIITRIDPIDIWNVNSVPKQLKPKKYTMDKLKNEKITESELPPPPIPISQRRRLMINGRATKKNIKKEEKAYKPISEKPESERVHGLEPPPKPLMDENENKRKRIIEDEHMPNPLGNFKHIALSFNVHLDKPLLIIGAQFADFAENNEKLRREQAKDLAKFVNLYQNEYHIVVVGDFNSVPEGRVLRLFAEDTGFENIGYKYFDKQDFTYLSDVSMGMGDNVFVCHAMYQKVQDAQIDYTHPRPIWPESNHLSLVIDFDTTWYGGWGGPIQHVPPFKSIQKGQNGEQDAIYTNDDDDSNDDNYHVYGQQMDAHHTNYHQANVEMDDNELVDYVRYKPERIDRYAKYEIIGENDIADTVLTENWMQKVFKYAIYAIVGSICLFIGGVIGWLFVGYYKSYKGRVVHVSRF